MLRVLELFAGIGACSKALERLGIEHEIVDAVEIDKYAIKSFNAIHGATNRKLGSDMGRAVTGGGLHGKDLSKADVSVNIVCHMMAQELGKEVEARCAIGDKELEFKVGNDEAETRKMAYDHVVTLAKSFVTCLGGFEKLAEWGLF